MKTISKQQLKNLCKNGTCIDSIGEYPSVIIHPDGTITKLWKRKKSLFSSDRFRSYAQRFIDNATGLTAKGINVPDILNHAVLEGERISIVSYRALPGNSIRDLLKDSPERVDIPALGRYILSLHDKGIFFRSIHFGNIILLPDNNYGLIDITDVRYYKNPVPLRRRAVNLATPLRYSDDADRIKAAQLPDLIDSYLSALEPNARDKERFLEQINRCLN